MQLSQDPPIAFDAIDVLDGLVTLERRSPTLDGSVPLRVAQACLPLLAGNAFGLQITLSSRIELTRRFGRWTLAKPLPAELERRVRATLPMLAARGLWQPHGAWAKAFESGLVSISPLPLSLFTGLFVRPREGIRLRLSSVKNRRSLAYDVKEAILDDSAGWTPLVLTVAPRGNTCILQGELATLAPLPATATFRSLAFEQAEALARAHLGFYDRAYFETKRGGEVSRAYRRRAALESSATVASLSTQVDYVDAGVQTAQPGAPPSFHRPSGPQTDATAAPDRLIVHNAVSFSAHYDGLLVQVQPDAGELARFSERVRARWKGMLPEGAHEGALLYLSKYVTPHPQGEPHFFVKPSMLFRTEPGTSLLLEGKSLEGAEILRGVTESDWFHATPAVFHLLAPGTSITVRAGAPLLELFPQSRRLAAATFELEKAGLTAWR